VLGATIDYIPTVMIICILLVVTELVNVCVCVSVFVEDGTIIIIIIMCPLLGDIIEMIIHVSVCLGYRTSEYTGLCVCYVTELKLFYVRVLLVDRVYVCVPHVR